MTSTQASPYSHRLEIALEEAGATYIAYPVDPHNKPDWYNPLVNPSGKVPAIAYGGPDVPPDQPSPESTKLVESLILIEFIADLFPESHILPQDPVKRAQARYFVDVVSNTFVPKWAAFLIKGQSPDALYTAIETIQNLLPDDTPYANGEHFSIADISIAAFLARLELNTKNDIGGYAAGEGTKFYETWTTDPKYAKFWAYYGRLKERESFRKTFDEVRCASVCSTSAPTSLSRNLRWSISAINSGETSCTVPSS
jgi:glutathione S-transferase